MVSNPVDIGRIEVLRMKGRHNTLSREIVKTLSNDAHGAKKYQLAFFVLGGLSFPLLEQFIENSYQILIKRS